MEAVYSSALNENGSIKRQVRSGMDAVDIAISSVLMGIGKTYGKKYVIPSQDKILILLKRFHGVRISRRTLNRRLAWLEAKGFIHRTCRHYLTPSDGWRFRSTMYRFKGKLFNQLNSLGKWISGLFRFYRVPSLADHKQLTKLRSASRAFGDVEKVLKCP